MAEFADLAVACSIQTPTGWLDLQDPENGYELDATSFAENNVTHRKVEVSSGWMEGSFVTRSVRENVSETLAVQVTGANSHDFADKVRALTAAFEQLSYQIVLSFETDQETWFCEVSDYTISTQQMFRFAHFGIVKAQVSRLPTVSLAVI